MSQVESRRVASSGLCFSSFTSTTCHPQFCHPSTSLLMMPRSTETFNRTTTLPHSSTTFSNWRNGQRDGSYVLTQTSVRSCTSVDKTPVKTTKQRWLQQPARGPWRVRRHRIDFRETHRDCCKPGQQNARSSVARILTSTASHC